MKLLKGKFWLKIWIIINLFWGESYMKKVVINEFNSDASEKLEINEFLELKVYYDLGETIDKKLDNYYAIVIQLSKRGNPIITTIANLTDNEFKENNLFVIGGSGIALADMSVDNLQLTFRHQFQTKQMANFLPNGDKSPLAIALLYSPEEIPGFTLSQQRKEISIDNNMLEIIKSRLIDMIVYARRALVESCTIFERLSPPYHKNRNYLLRDFDPAWGKDLSLSRCTDYTDSFVPEFFKLSNPTPGLENECNMFAYNFKGKLIELTPALTRIQPNNPSNIQSCTAPDPPEVYESIITDKVKKRFEELSKTYSGQHEQSCSRNLDMNMREYALTTTVEKVIDMGEDPDDLADWESTKKFNPLWIETMKKKVPGKMPVDLIAKTENIKKWFNFDPKSLTYNCRICAPNFEIFGISSVVFTRLADPMGISANNDFNSNYKFIKEHQDSKAHIAVVNKLKEYKMDKVQDYFFDMNTKIEIKKKELAATAKMFRLIFVEVLSNVAFNQHKTLIQLMIANGVNIGTHFQNHMAAKVMTASMSNFMHSKLLKFLKTKGENIGLIVDTSNDYNKNHYLSVLFQTLENNKIQVFFYKLIKLGKDETGKAMSDILIKNLQQDGLDGVLLTKLVAFTSDGASSMIGIRNGMIANLRKVFNKKKIYANHCSAHRLQLAIKDAWGVDNFRKKFEGLINDLHTFYYGSYKRISSLRDTAEKEPDFKFLELKYIFEIRWINSEYDALRSIIADWKVLVINLNEMISSPTEYDEKTRDKAKEFLNILLDKNYVLFLHFFTNIMQVMKRYSLAFQQKGGTIIGKGKLINDLIEGLDDLKETDGSIMEKYLREVNCELSVFNRKCKVETYELPQKIFWQGFELNKENEDIYPLSRIRIPLLNGTISELQRTFPDLQSGYFDIFSPDIIAQNQDNFDNFGIEELNAIYELFSWQKEFKLNDLHTDWANSLKKMFSLQDIWVKVIGTPSNIFWSTYLSTKEMTFNKPMLTLIKTVLVIAIGSADAERSFSYMNNLQSVHTGLGGEFLDHLLRIKMNGPLDISQFRAFDFAENWVYNEKHTKVDDTSIDYTKRTKQPDEDDDKIYYSSRSSLF